MPKPVVLYYTIMDVIIFIYFPKGVLLSIGAYRFDRDHKKRDAIILTINNYKNTTHKLTVGLKPI